MPLFWLQEVAEPLQDLKEGMDQLEKNKTLRYILGTLLAIGNFLNASNVSLSLYYQFSHCLCEINLLLKLSENSFGMS